MNSDSKKNKEELKIEKKGFGKLCEDELDMVNGGVGEYIEPEPASLPDPESLVPQSPACIDPELKLVHHIWDE